jgi:hypothetical protein
MNIFKFVKILLKPSFFRSANRKEKKHKGKRKKKKQNKKKGYKMKNKIKLKDKKQNILKKRNIKQNKTCRHIIWTLIVALSTWSLTCEKLVTNWA